MSKRSFRDGGGTIKNLTARGLPDGPVLEEGWFTQYGKADTAVPFRASPRFEELNPPEYDVSVFLGKLTLEQTVYAMLGRLPRPHHRHRHFSIERLVSAAYRCIHTPSRKRLEHASILAGCPGQDLEIHRQWWAHPKREGLDSLAEEVSDA